ncbi:hypothetical protein MCEGKSE7_00038 [Candidatus Nanopelagicaceae bacterium]
MKALVLGNGPSLGKINLENVKEMQPDIFVVNSFNQLAISAEIKPDYYCLSDPDSIIKPDRSVPHNSDSTFEYITQRKCTLILSHFYRKIKISESINRIYFNDKEFTLFGRNLNPCFPRGYSSLTILKAIAVALYMGYDKIYILGVDNTEFKSLVGNIDNKTLLETNNLYADNSLVHMSYIFGSAGGIAGQFLQYANWFGDFSKFPQDRIINLDTESLIDAFQKQKIIS